MRAGLSSRIWGQSITCTPLLSQQHSGCWMVSAKAASLIRRPRSEFCLFFYWKIIFGETLHLWEPCTHLINGAVLPTAEDSCEGWKRRLQMSIPLGQLVSSWGKLVLGRQINASAYIYNKNIFYKISFQNLKKFSSNSTLFALPNI